MAQEHGWEPTGTGAPRELRIADWSGSYFSNNGQRVYVRDARSLADALERAIDAMPLPPPDTKENYLYSENGRAALREFIAFCRAGTFRIY